MRVLKEPTYSDYYEAFSQNVNFAARILHYYLHIGKLAADKQNYKALNKTPRFWSDYNYIALQTVMVFLGKIFDSQKRTHNIGKLLEILPSSLEHFNKANLKQRKISAGGEFEGLDKYIGDAHELTIEDVNLIKAEAKKAMLLWDKFEPLRHCIYAHDQMLSDKQRDELFGSVTYDELKQLIQILLNISFILEQAEINGRKPDFKDYDDAGAINRANGEVNTLLSTLVSGI